MRDIRYIRRQGARELPESLLKRRIRLMAPMALAMMCILAQVVFALPMRTEAADTSQTFIPSTPEMQKKRLTLAGEKAKCLEALNVLYDAGVSPMAIAEKLFGDKTAAASQESESAAVQATSQTETGSTAQTVSSAETDDTAQATSEAETGSTAQAASDAGTDATEKGGSLGDAAIAAAQKAGDKLVDDASTEVEKTKRSLLDTLKENIKEAATSLVDALFAKL